MQRPIAQTLKDLDILVDALKHNEQWRFDLVRERVAADLGGRGQAAMAADPYPMIDLFRSLINDAETRHCDIPETKPPEGRFW